MLEHNITLYGSGCNPFNEPFISTKNKTSNVTYTPKGTHIIIGKVYTPVIEVELTTLTSDITIIILQNHTSMPYPTSVLKIFAPKLPHTQYFANRTSNNMFPVIYSAGIIATDKTIIKTTPKSRHQ